MNDGTGKNVGKASKKKTPKHLGPSSGPPHDKPQCNCAQLRAIAHAPCKQQPVDPEILRLPIPRAKGQQSSPGQPRFVPQRGDCPLHGNVLGAILTVTCLEPLCTAAGPLQLKQKKKKKKKKLPYEVYTSDSEESLDTGTLQMGTIKEQKESGLDKPSHGDTGTLQAGTIKKKNGLDKPSHGDTGTLQAGTIKKKNGLDKPSHGDTGTLQAGTIKKKNGLDKPSHGDTGTLQAGEIKKKNGLDKPSHGDTGTLQAGKIKKKNGLDKPSHGDTGILQSGKREEQKKSGLNKPSQGACGLVPGVFKLERSSVPEAHQSLAFSSVSSPQERPGTCIEQKSKKKKKKKKPNDTSPAACATGSDASELCQPRESKAHDNPVKSSADAVKQGKQTQQTTPVTCTKAQKALQQSPTPDGIDKRVKTAAKSLRKLQRKIDDAMKNSEDYGELLFFCVDELTANKGEVEQALKDHVTRLHALLDQHLQHHLESLRQRHKHHLQQVLITRTEEMNYQGRLAHLQREVEDLLKRVSESHDDTTNPNVEVSALRTKFNQTDTPTPDAKATSLRYTAEIPQVSATGLEALAGRFVFVEEFGRQRSSCHDVMTPRMTNKDLTTPAASEATNKDLTTPAASEATNKDLTTPAASEATNKDLTTPAASEATNKDLTTPAASEATNKDLTTPAASEATNKDLTTPAASEATNKDLTTPAASEATNKDLTTPAASEATNKDLTTPAASEATNKDLTTPAASEATNKDLTTPAASEATNKDLTTPAASEALVNNKSRDNVSDAAVMACARSHDGDCVASSQKEPSLAAADEAYKKLLSKVFASRYEKTVNPQPRATVAAQLESQTKFEEQPRSEKSVKPEPRANVAETSVSHAMIEKQPQPDKSAKLRPRSMVVPKGESPTILHGRSEQATDLAPGKHGTVWVVYGDRDNHLDLLDQFGDTVWSMEIHEVPRFIAAIVDDDVMVMTSCPQQIKVLNTATSQYVLDLPFEDVPLQATSLSYGEAGLVVSFNSSLLWFSEEGEGGVWIVRPKKKPRLTGICSTAVMTLDGEDLIFAAVRGTQEVVIFQREGSNTFLALPSFEGCDVETVIKTFTPRSISAHPAGFLAVLDSSGCDSVVILDVRRFEVACVIPGRKLCEGVPSLVAFARDSSETKNPELFVATLSGVIYRTEMTFLY